MTRVLSVRRSALRTVPPSRAPLSLSSLLGGCARAARAHVGGQDASAPLRAELCRRYQAEDVILTASGTDALRLAFETAFNVRGRRRAALPGYSCYALATAAVGARAETDLYDVDPDTLSPDFDSLTACVLDGVDAIVVSHLYGYPADVPAALGLAISSGAILVEDAAQEGGGLLGGRRLGTLAPLSVLSFGRGKAVTCGGGGALLIRDSRLTSIARDIGARLAPSGAGWREVLRAAAEWTFGRPLLYGIPASLPFLRLGETRFETPREPRAMAAGAAGLLEASLDAGDAWIQLRRDRAARLKRLLSDLPDVALMRPIQGALPGELRLPFRVRNRPARGVPMLGLVPGYPATLRELAPLRSTLRTTGRATPGAALLARTLLTAPTHPLTTGRDLEAVRDCLCPDRPHHAQRPTARLATAPAFL